MEISDRLVPLVGAFNFRDLGGYPTMPPDAQVVLAMRYLWYLDVGREAIVEALTMAAEPDHHPLVFHRAAGKDRTGVVAALLLDILDIERSVIVEDYAFTATRMDLILSRFERGPDAEARIAEIPPFMLRAEAATRETFLHLLDQHHGGARAWALAAGLPAERLEAMATHLVTGGREVGPPK
ncbi:MAG: tyrosine-protein phosphatase [Acidimicrobiales bacterium]